MAERDLAKAFAKSEGRVEEVLRSGGVWPLERPLRGIVVRLNTELVSGSLHQVL